MSQSHAYRKPFAVQQNHAFKLELKLFDLIIIKSNYMIHSNDTNFIGSDFNNDNCHCQL